MTDEQIAALGPAFAAELRRYRDGFGRDRTARHFDNYCRGLLSDAPRKSVEPVALASGTAVRTSRSSWSPPTGSTSPRGSGSSGGWPTPWRSCRPTRSG